VRFHDFTFARLDRAILFVAAEKDARVKPGQGESNVAMMIATQARNHAIAHSS